MELGLCPIWNDGSVFDSAAGCAGWVAVWFAFENRLSSGTLNRLVWYGLYGYTLCMVRLLAYWQEWSAGSSGSSLRERLRFRTGSSGSWIRWLRVRLDGKPGEAGRHCVVQTPGDAFV